MLHTLPDLGRRGESAIVLQHLLHRDRSRFEVEVAYLGGPTELLDRFAATGAPLHRLDPNAGRARLIAGLLHIVRRDRIELLHVHGPLDREVGIVVGALARVPVVCHIHLEHVHLGARPAPAASRRQRWSSRAGAAWRDGIERRVVTEYLADSEAAAELFRPLVSQPVRAMTMGLEPLRSTADDAARAALRRRLGLGQGPMLLNVARLVAGKGQDRLIDLLVEIRRRRPDAELVLVGDGPERAALRAHAERLGLAGAVHLVGGRDDIADLLALADLFVFASRSESLGVAVLEALSAEVPVVLFELPSLAGITVDGHTARVIEQHDDDGFVDAVDQLLEDRDRGRSLGAAAAHEIAARFGPEATARSFEQTYRSVLATAAAATVVDLTEASDVAPAEPPTPRLAQRSLRG